jgi:hypothetical protein
MAVNALTKGENRDNDVKGKKRRQGQYRQRRDPSPSRFHPINSTSSQT